METDPFASLKAAAQNAANTQIAAAKTTAGAQAPAVGYGTMPEVTKSMESSYALPIAQDQAGLAAYNASVKTSGSGGGSGGAKAKFKMVKKPDGGYAFFDADGNQLSAFEYAQAMGATPDQVLADSENPIDIRYRKDFEELQNYISSLGQYKSNPDARDYVDTTNAAVLEATGLDLSKVNAQEVIEKFKQAYPTVYGKAYYGKPAVAKPGQNLFPGTTSNMIKAYQLGADGIGL